MGLVYSHRLALARVNTHAHVHTNTLAEQPGANATELRLHSVIRLLMFLISLSRHNSG